MEQEIKFEFLLGLIVLVIVLFLYLNKIDNHFKVFYHQKDEPYNGFWKAYFELTFLEKSKAFLPILITNSDFEGTMESNANNESVQNLKRNIRLLWLSILLLVILALF